MNLNYSNKAHLSECFLPKINNSRNKNLLDKENCFLNSHRSIDCLSVSSNDSIKIKSESEFKHDFFKNQSNYNDALKSKSNNKTKNLNTFCLYDLKYNYFPFDKDEYKISKKQKYDARNPILKYRYHFTSYCSFDYIITIVKVYEEIITNYLYRISGYDGGFLPRIHVLPASKSNFNKEPVNSFNKFVKIRRKNISEIIKKATQMAEYLEKFHGSNRENGSAENNSFDNLSWVLDFQKDSESIFTTNSSVTENFKWLIDEYKKWVRICEDEFRNW